jgi:HK97 gp10 family phage protein
VVVVVEQQFYVELVVVDVVVEHEQFVVVDVEQQYVVVKHVVVFVVVEQFIFSGSVARPMAHNDHLRARAIRRYTSASLAALEMLGSAGEREEKRLLGKQGTPRRRSAPGEPPRRQTGLLRDEIDHDVDATKQTVRIGILGGEAAAGHYLRFLEEGTEKMAPRPSLRPMLAALATRIVPALRSQYRRIR